MGAPVFGAESVPLAVSDRRRYRTAERMLQSAERMVAIEHAVAALDPHGTPATRCFVGRSKLRRAGRIGLLSGSFNPLTHAHVAVADAARAQAQLDALIWAEAVVIIDKERVTRAALPDRLAQLVAFARPRHEIVALLNRGLYVEQVQALRSVTRLSARIFVVVGFDKVVQIFDPHYYTDRETALAALFSAADLLVAPRAGAGRRELGALLRQSENQAYAKHVTLLGVPDAYLYDSSTETRQLASAPDAHREELARLVPPEALALIDTQAYAPTETYTLRQAWLTVLQSLPPDVLRRLPPIRTLVARTGASDQWRHALFEAQRHPTALTAPELLQALGLSPSVGG